MNAILKIDHVTLHDYGPGITVMSLLPEAPELEATGDLGFNFGITFFFSAGDCFLPSGSLRPAEHLRGAHQKGHRQC